MAKDILMVNIVEIKTIETFKRYIKSKIFLDTMYKEAVNLETLEVIFKLKKLSAMIQIPLEMNDNDNLFVSYQENKEALEKWSCHYRTEHGRDKICEYAAQLLAEAIYFFRTHGKPPYFKEYKNMVIETLSCSWDNSKKQFLEEVFNI